MKNILQRSVVELYIYIFFISISFLAILLKYDILLFANLGIIVVIGSIFLLKNKHLLLLVGITVSIFQGGLSTFISGTYVVCYIYILMLIAILISRNKIRFDKFILVLCIVTLLLNITPLIFNGTSIPILLISILKRFGFIIVYIYTLNLLSFSNKKQDVISKLFVWFLIINFFVAVIQFSKGTYLQDSITGLLGYGMSGILIYLFMMYIGVISGFHYKKKLSLFSFILLVLIPLVYSAIAEVKVGFVTTTILLMIYFFFINRNYKSFISLAIIFIILINIYSLFVSFYPNHDFANKAFLEKYLVEQDYGADGSINRFNFADKIDTIIFSNQTERFLGMGLGSGNPSEIDMLKGNLFVEFDYMKYRWFTLPYLYVESGLIGLILYISIYLTPLIYSLKHFKKWKSPLSVTAILMSVTNLMFLPYNSGLLDFGVITVFWTFIAFLKLEEIEFRKKNE